MNESPPIHTLDGFQPLVRQNFTLAQDGLDETIEAELVEAKASPYEAAPNAIRVPFSILFRFDPIYAPQQCVCTGSHDAIDSMVLLLVPVEEDEKGYYMEAVFG